MSHLCSNHVSPRRDDAVATPVDVSKCASPFGGALGAPSRGPSPFADVATRRAIADGNSRYPAPTGGHGSGRGVRRGEKTSWVAVGGMRNCRWRRGILERRKGDLRSRVGMSFDLQTEGLGILADDMMTVKMRSLVTATRGLRRVGRSGSGWLPAVWESQW